MSLVLLEQRGSTAIISINDPESRNALGRAVRLEMLPLLEQVSADDSVRAIVLTGHGKNFCSGGNIKDMSAERTLADARAVVDGGGKLARALFAGPKPLIAAVEGYAAGAGFSLAVGADYVVSSNTSTYISAFCKVGILPDMGMLWSLTQRVGMGQAKRIIASARKVSAVEAFDLGIVDQLSEPGQALEDALAVAEEFSVGAPLAFTVMKRAFAQGVNSLDDALRVELDNQSALYLTHDHREAVAAFIEKRQPVFKGC